MNALRESIKAVDWKDVWNRALKTFIQAVVSYFGAQLAGVNFFSGDRDKTFWIGLLVSGGAAGVSAG